MRTLVTARVWLMVAPALPMMLEQHELKVSQRHDGQHAPSRVFIWNKQRNRLAQRIVSLLLQRKVCGART